MDTCLVWISVVRRNGRKVEGKGYFASFASSLSDVCKIGGLDCFRCSLRLSVCSSFCVSNIFKRDNYGTPIHCSHRVQNSIYIFVHGIIDTRKGNPTEPIFPY